LSRGSTLGVLALAAASCTQVTSTFVCTDDLSCTSSSGTPGICEPNHRCSVMDPSCPETQQRYTDYAGEFSNQCTAPFDCISDVRAGDLATCALKKDGSVWCWGGGNLTPVNIKLPVAGVVEIAMGGAGLCARDANQVVYCSPSPFQAMTMIPQLVAIGLTVGQSHMCAVTVDNHVACWGMNRHGQLGDDVGDGHQPSVTPVIAKGLNEVTQVSAGVDSTCAVTSAGSLSCWGDDSSGQAGCGVTCFGDDTTPTSVLQGPPDASSVTAGDQFACARTTAGEVWCWGSNRTGQLGDPGVSGEAHVPHLIPQAPSGITQLSSAGGHSCAVGAGGLASCWGGNESHQSSSGAGSTVAMPAPVVDKQGQPRRFADVQAGTSHTCGLSTDGVVRCWGSNGSGEIGDGTMVPAGWPTPAQLFCP
jgi:hypothetical protein